MSDLVVCQVDGMDQGKYRLPRDPKLKATASVPLGPESIELWTWPRFSNKRLILVVS